MKLWGGRFEKDTSEELNDFNSSIHVDSRMYLEDISGSIAHVTMLSKCNIISKKDSDLIVNALKEILMDIEENKCRFSKDAEDIHMNIETLLIEKIGDVGKKLHTARSRNDQVALDIRMYLKKEIRNISELLLNLQKVLLDLGRENVKTIMPGYTHLQRAQGITFSHHLMAYSEMFKRDYERLEDCYKRVNSMPLGSAALATTTYSIDRNLVKELLDFESVTKNSIDSVSDRDFVIELANDLSLIMMHLSRFSEEIILWCSSEFSFLSLDDEYSTGSSIMPQKKNPDVAELVRGKTGRVYGNLMALLTVMKALPLAYNKDMQEDKELIFDSIDTVKSCLPIFGAMLKTCKVNKDNMKKACYEGFINATDLADYLCKQGIPFRDAHKILGEMVSYCINNEKKLEELSLSELKDFSKIFNNDVYEVLDVNNSVEARDIIGGPSSKQINLLLDELENYLKIKSEHSNFKIK
ncbi:argininosuccinate lyase [Clostridium tarantellae]|uniref:Argininosuccinate lyase n=1 Tax=Clostridium tarantellae TaxID=39493 RepID=A0A6I1MJL2_9CLOT|nr:argininosuccinate lyase [Clostridium tarantellae]MPQ42598.1 argininosuccinate lyase [Clostridium tarantellae]